MKTSIKKCVVYVICTCTIIILMSACTKKLPTEINRQVLKQSLESGTSYLLNNQKPNGSFNYQYNWHTKKFSAGNNQVRQAGVQWGLALIFNHEPSDKVQKALERSIQFFIRHSRVTDKEARYIVFPKSYRGSTGTVALCALTLVDYLRTIKNKAEIDTYKKYKIYLDQYINFLVLAMNKDNLWHAQYDNKTGRPYGPHSQYFDGEALLALVKAAKYMDRADLVPVIRKAIDAGIKTNIEEALANNPDSPVTKGYYQWSSMAMFEIATSGWENTEQYGNHVIRLADWMIDVHRTLARTRNTGYAYEGIIHAYKLALDKNDDRHVQKFRNVIRTGLKKLTSWQVGGPMPNTFIREHDQDDDLAIGGIQNHKKEPFLRIDVTQHQMHAVILALRYVYTDDKE